MPENRIFQAIDFPEIWEKRPKPVLALFVRHHDNTVLSVVISVMREGGSPSRDRDRQNNDSLPCLDCYACQSHLAHTLDILQGAATAPDGKPGMCDSLPPVKSVALPSRIQCC